MKAGPEKVPAFFIWHSQKALTMADKPEEQAAPLTLAEAAAAYSNAENAVAELQARREEALNRLREIDDSIAASKKSRALAHAAMQSAMGGQAKA